MEKIIVEIIVPVLNSSYDVFISPFVPLHQVLTAVTKAVQELSEGRFMPGPGTVFCREGKGTVLDINKTAWEQGIRNGSRLLLI